MWIKQFWQWLRGRGDGHDSWSTPRAALLSRWRQLTDRRIRDYEPAMGMGTVFEADWGNIVAYTGALRWFESRARAGEPITITDLPTLRHTVSVDAFLLDDKGHYATTDLHLSRLRDAALALLEALESSDYVDHGVPAHNLRVLGRVLQNLDILITSLLEATQH